MLLHRVGRNQGKQTRWPRLNVECLEERQVLSTSVGPLTDPTPISGLQGIAANYPPQVAIAGNGDHFVIAWTEFPSTTSEVVKARLLDKDGSFLSDVITVTASPLAFDPAHPVKVDVSMDAQGRFAVVYDGLPNNSGLADLGMQRYLADGTPYGTTVSIGSSVRVESDPSIALSSTGRILVAYNQATSNGLTNRSVFTLYASFENVSSNSTTSISSTGPVLSMVSFNDEGVALLVPTIFPSGTAKTSLRIIQANGAVGASQIVNSAVPSQLVADNIPGTNEWRIVYLDQSSGQYNLQTSIVHQGLTPSAAPLVSSPQTLTTDVGFTARPALDVDAAGNFGVAYYNASNQLVVGLFDSSGASLGAPLVVGPGFGATFDFAAGATVQEGFVPYSVQTSGTTLSFAGTLVDFEIRGFSLLTPVSAEVPPSSAPPSLTLPNNDSQLAILLTQLFGAGQYSATSKPAVAVVDLLFSLPEPGASGLFATYRTASGGGNAMDSGFLDINGNGIQDPGEPSLGSETSTPSGNTRAASAGQS